MTAKSILVTTALLLILLSLVKLFFISLFDLTSWYMTALYLIVTGLVSVGIIRRTGILNHFEVFIGLVFWTPLLWLWDFSFLTAILGYDIFKHFYIWLGYVVMVLAIAIFHKWAPLDKG